MRPRKAEGFQLSSWSRPPVAGSPRSPLFRVPVLGHPGPAMPDLVPPGWRIPQSRYAVSRGFEVETKFLFSPLCDPQEGDHPVRLTMTPKLPWPIFQPDLTKLDIQSSTPDVGKFQLDGKLKLLPNIGGSGVSVGLEADGGIKYNHDLTTREGKLKGVFESLVVVDVLS